MKNVIPAALSLLVLAAGCSHSKESKQAQQEEAAQATPPEQQTLAPVEGVISSVDPERIELRAEAMEEPETFERTSRTLVLRDGQEVAWEELGQGEAVRVTYDAGIFGPDRITSVEILGGPEADRIRSESNAPEGSRSPMEPEGVETPTQPGSLEPRPVAPLTPPPDDTAPGGF